MKKLIITFGLALLLTGCSISSPFTNMATPPNVPDNSCRTVLVDGVCVSVTLGDAHVQV